MTPEQWQAIRQQFIDRSVANIDACGSAFEQSGGNQTLIDDAIKTLAGDHGKAFASFTFALRDANQPPTP